MLNAEKYRDEILEFINKKGTMYFSFKKDNVNMFEQCCETNCDYCSLYSENSTKEPCTIKRIKWLLSEYKEPIKLSTLEHELLKHLYKTGYSYIVRDGSNSVYAYEKRPCRNNLYWSPGDVNHNDDISLYRLSYLFQFLKWSDEEPTLIQDVLNNCEVIDDD